MAESYSLGKCSMFTRSCWGCICPIFLCFLTSWKKLVFATQSDKKWLKLTKTFKSELLPKLF